MEMNSTGSVRGMTRGLLVAVLLGAFPAAALAQLNEHCVVSVLNRTVEVKPNGSWVLPNVPANIGRVRARASRDLTVPVGQPQTPFVQTLPTGQRVPQALQFEPSLLVSTQLPPQLVVPPGHDDPH